MSEFVDGQKLALPRLLGALLVIGTGFSATDAAATSLGQLSSSSALSKIRLAQSSECDWRSGR